MKTKMKTQLLLASAAVLLLSASCQKNEVDLNYEGDNNAIAFSVYSGREAVKAYTEYDLANGYHVYADFDGSAYFDDTFVNDQAASTATTPKTYYWPAGISGTKKLLFYAVAPKTTTLNASRQVEGFNAASGETDLVVAKTECSAKVDPVPLTFSHALAKINKITLSPKAGDGSATADYYYNVEELKITGKTVGTCDFSSTPTWSSLTTDGTYSYISSTESFTGNDTREKATVYAVIPQTLTISVKYNISYKSATGVSILASVTKTGTLEVEQGKAYSISIALPNDGTPIKFSATVTSWTDATPSVDVTTPTE